MWCDAHLAQPCRSRQECGRGAVVPRKGGHPGCWLGLERSWREADKASRQGRLRNRAGL